MTNKNYNHSLGALTLVENRQNPKSPQMKGKISIKRHDLETLIAQLENSNAHEGTADLAAWQNQDNQGKPFLTIQLQPRTYHSAKTRKPTPANENRSIFDYLNHDCA